MELSTLIEKVTEGHDLSVPDAAAAFGTVMSGDASPVQIAALLAALRTKGHAASEVAGGVQALQDEMIRVEASTDRVLVDTCGTGGGSVTTFNISTAAAFVVAGAGVGVAKHGNRSFTSKSGSADVLEALEDDGRLVRVTPNIGYERGAFDNLIEQGGGVLGHGVLSTRAGRQAAARVFTMVLQFMSASPH